MRRTITLNRFLLISALLLAHCWSNWRQVEGAPSGRSQAASNDGAQQQQQQQEEQQQQDQQQQRQQFERQLARKLQLVSGETNSNEDSQDIDNGQEIARQQLIRLQRSTTTTTASQAAAPSAPLLPQQLLSLQLLEDERLMRHQLPELIAQARTDKTIERALIKMLIQASLRPQQQQQQQQQQTILRNQPEVWQQQDDGGNSGNLLANFPLVPNVLQLSSRPPIGRSEQLVAELGDGAQSASASSSFVSDLAALISPQLVAMDKREYIKPCSFNAISCKQRSLRKLIAS